MIITCTNCKKKFNVDPNIIPENGRLLQCNGCNYKWFFKKEIVNKAPIPVKFIKAEVETQLFKEEFESVNIEKPKNFELLDKQINNDLIIEKISSNDAGKENDNTYLKTSSSKNKKSYNILNLIIIFIISFTAIIILLDTFQLPIGKIVPNIEFLLYNLYETINDIKLFLKDLI